MRYESKITSRSRRAGPPLSAIECLKKYVTDTPLPYLEVLDIIAGNVITCNIM